MTPTKQGLSPAALFFWFVVGLLLGIAFAGIITLFAWNVGLVAALGAFGVTVGKITFIQAAAINFGGLVIRSVIGRQSPAAGLGKSE